MVEASAEGIIDFTAIRPRDPHWWIHFRAMLGYLERRKSLQWATWSREFHQAKYAVDRITDDSFSTAQKETGKLIADTFDLLFPWLQENREGVLVDEARELRDAWVERFGDPDDPEIQERIQKTVETLNNRSGAAQQRQEAEDAAVKIRQKKMELEKLVEQRRRARANQRRR
jgi:hypothetical protein